MQINITNKEGHFSRLIKKLTVVFFGIFLTSLIFAVTTTLSGKYGIIMGLLACGLLIFAGFYYVNKESRLRAVAWTMLVLILIIAVLFFIFNKLILGALDFRPTE